MENIIDELNTLSQSDVELKLQNYKTALEILGISGEKYRELLHDYIKIGDYYRKRFGLYYWGHLPRLYVNKYNNVKHDTNDGSTNN